jgi:antibiotic biosynthesis monooxygenase (ABM) superfamily enzyme
MPTALFTVKSTITPEREKEFNEWYNHEHIPDVFKFKGVVSARRYKAIMPEDKFQYIAVYEFESEEALRRFLSSDHLGWLKKEFDSHFGDVTERQRAAYVQVWP